MFFVNRKQYLQVKCFGQEYFSSDAVFSALHHIGRHVTSGCLTISDAKCDFWVKVVTARSLLDLLKGSPSLCFAHLLLIRGVLILTASPPGTAIFLFGVICFLFKTQSGINSLIFLYSTYL